MNNILIAWEMSLGPETLVRGRSVPRPVASATSSYFNIYVAYVNIYVAVSHGGALDLV